MVARIEVRNHKEAEMLRAGLAQADVRAFVLVAGALAPLSDRAKRRTLSFVADHLAERTGLDGG